MQCIRASMLALCSRFGSMNEGGSSSSGSKRPRLTEYSRNHHVSTAALAQILASVKEHGLPDAISSQTFRRQRREDAETPTSFGTLLQEHLVVGSSTKIWVQHPMGFLEVASKKSEGFRVFLRSVLDKCDSRIKLCVYSDAVDPGKELAIRHGRKVECLYWSILEFGPLALSHESMWFTLSLVREDIVTKLEGGMSQLFNSVLALFFDKENGCDLRSGVLVNIGEQARLIFGDISIINQDALAHKTTTLCFGAGGRMLCALCQNIYDHKMKPRPGMLPSTTIDDKDFIPHTDDTVRRVLGKLKVLIPNR